MRSVRIGVCRDAERRRSIARTRAYEAVQQIRFEGMQYRSDIGYRAVRKS